MMKLNDFLSKLDLAYDEPNIYEKGGWGKWNGEKWGWDCVCLIKGILWGWNDDTSKPRGGGAIYGSNGVPDIGTEKMIEVCTDVSSDFSKIQVGQMVWMQGHVGICTKPIDNTGYGEITEATVAFGWSGIIKTKIDKNGNRTYEGSNEKSIPWVKYGYLPYIDYENSSTDEIVVGDWVEPIKLVNYNGIPLKQYDIKYIVTQIIDDKAILSAVRNIDLEVWATMNINDIKKVQ